ncbi:hypothetical protein ACFQBQ_16010 [Granulicella cerasi]|uniref:Uncharacterized protein n=1 Tax=Granulicella cerasi TaxID=741063 RepID=A0ABW1ZE94_9BACT|nr:hypothetical protein [Granulicella cerasi]
MPNDAPMDSPKSKQLLGFLFRAQKWGFNRCLAPGDECKSHAINSHSIQNAKVLDLLSRNGHVKMIKYEMKKDDFIIAFQDIGRNQASTFGGFCSDHDTEIFKPIDLQQIDEANTEQLFLLAYRSVAKEVHSSMQAASISQSAYQKRVTLGIDNGNEPEPAGMMAIERMMAAYNAHQYKLLLDEAIGQADYSRLEHISFWIDHAQPSCAVSALFDIDKQAVDTEAPWVAMNLFPVSNSKSFVLFSFLPEEAPRARDYLREVVSASGDYQKYLLSRLVIKHCENFVVAPAIFDTWSQDKAKDICEFFRDTLRFDKAVDNSNLYLF